MSYVYIDNEPDLQLVVGKEMRPYFESQSAPRFGLDFETTTLMDRSNETLYKVPQPLPIPARWVTSLLNRQTFLMEREGYTATMQIGADPLIYDRQWVIDSKKIAPKVIASHVGDILSKSFILGHSLRYECSFLEEEYDITLDPNKILDIRIIDQLLIAGSSRKTGLMDAYRRYLDYGFFIAQTLRSDGTKGMDFSSYEVYKEEMQLSEWGNEVLTQRQLWYAADDVRLPHFVYERLKERLRAHYARHPRSNLLQRVKLCCAVVPESAYKYVRGITFDVEYHNTKVIPYLEKKKEEEYELAAAVCPNPNPVVTKGRGRGKKRVFFEYQAPINFRAPEQIKKSLVKLGVRIPNTEEKTLKENRGAHPAVEHILRYKKAANMLSKYGHMLPKYVHLDGKIHADFGQIGTETQRFAYWAPPMQTIPNKEKLFREINAGVLFRTAFVAESDEYVLLDCDLPNIEPRLITQLTQEKGLLLAFTTKVDYHGFTAQILMDLDYIPKKGDWHREKIGKIGNLSLGYGASFKTLKENMLKYTLDDPEPIRWTDDFAKQKHKAYFDALPAVAAKIAEVQAKVEKALANHDSLADFAGQRPIFEVFTEWEKTPSRSHMCYRSFYLWDWQEELARTKVVTGDPRKHPLHRNYQVVEFVYEQDEFGKNKLNSETGEPIKVLDAVTGEPKLKKHYYNAFKKMTNDISREAYNFMIQAEGACILKRIIVKLGVLLRENGFPKKEGVILTVHDELLLMVHRSRAEIGKRLLKQAMEEACYEVIVDMPIECEPGGGSSWSEAVP